MEDENWKKIKAYMISKKSKDKLDELIAESKIESQEEEEDWQTILWDKVFDGGMFHPEIMSKQINIPEDVISKIIDDKTDCISDYVYRLEKTIKD